MLKFEILPPSRFDNAEHGLEFRPFNSSDIDALVTIATDSPVTRFVPWAKWVTDTESADRQIREFNQTYEQGTRVRYAVVKDDELVGYAGLWPDAKNGYFEFGFAVVPSRRGQGIGSSILKGLMHTTAIELNATGLIAYVHDDNISSKATVVKEGFIPTNEFDEGDRRYEYTF